MKSVGLLLLAGSLLGSSLVACDESASKPPPPPRPSARSSYVAPSAAAAPASLGRQPDTADEAAGKARAMLAQAEDYMGTSKWREANAMLHKLETTQASLPPELGDQLTRDQTRVDAELAATGAGSGQPN